MTHPGLTPKPAQTPRANVTDLADYKLNIDFTNAQADQWQVRISRWTPEFAWRHLDLFLTYEELQKFKRLVDAG